MKKAFSIIKKLFIYSTLSLLVLAISGYIYLYVLPKGPGVTEATTLKEGTDSFVMYAYKESKRKSIRVWTYKPAEWQNGDQIVFVMHGGGRNADDYLKTWTQHAEEHNLLVIAPEFASKFARITTNDYQEGNLFTFFGSPNPRKEWAYTVVENIFDHIKSINGITNDHYDIFGHSAGGRFVHRMIMVLPEARVGTAVAANAGFYTFPDQDLKYPYGIKGTPIHLIKAYQKRLIVLLGEKDNDPNLGTFRTTELAMEQGGNRLERGSNFFTKNLALKNEKAWAFKWQIDTVKNVGHDYRKMSKSALKWIIKDN